MRKLILVLFFGFLSSYVFSQNEFYLAVYPDSITLDADVVIKENFIELNIDKYNKITTYRKRVVTVYNQNGLSDLDAAEYFDKSSYIKNIEAKIYNAFGKEIKKIKQKDFKENSVTQGSIITDNRVLYLDYTPIQYPFTMVFESERVTSNTAFIPYWMPIEGYNISVIKSELKINYAADVFLKYKEYNSNGSIKTDKKEGSVTFSVANLKAYDWEQLSPALNNFVPYVLIGLDEFELEGVKGNAKDWTTLGTWMYNSLLTGTDVIEEETVLSLKKHIGSETDKIKIAKTIYNYVQNKTRYVSVQLGIGGWKPMLAKDVDRLGYGDCKALTNYTRSLLKIFDIPSYYTIVYSGSSKRDFHSDFVSMQGNHAILGIPIDDQVLWLECTSQTQPFGFQGDFTDDRKVLIVSENKIEIIKTAAYNNDKNEQVTNSKIILNTDGSLDVDLNINSVGMELDEKLFLENQPEDKIIKYYKNRFSEIKNSSIKSREYNLDKDKIILNEQLTLKSNDFINTNINQVFVPVNFVNQISFVPKSYSNRANPFEVERGYVYRDEIELTLPENYKLDAISTDFEIDTEFGSYTSKVTVVNEKIMFNRTFKLKKGTYAKEQYNDYVLFREKIARNENAKMVLLKK